jgi:1-aminocyclopropane-1-carboxylate deaminase/D-cysteine desulfhydrase-like pyridoxal-dependent ACC family enzyme
MISKLLEEIPQFSLSILPTPLYKLKQLSAVYKKNIYCLRDDMTGFAFGGNKTRKLDFLLAEAQKSGYNTLIGVGANQSNFCRLTAAAGKTLGFEVHLLLSGQKPVKPTANILLDHLFGAIIHHTDAFENEQVENESLELEKELVALGRKVYRMPLGGSAPLGTLGYLKAFDEILNYSEVENVVFDDIFLASGSGGTQAGLVLGKMISGWQGKIHGISVGRSAMELKQVVSNLVDGSVNLLKIENKPVQVEVDDNFIGERYGAFTSEAPKGYTAFCRKRRDFT